MPVELLTHHLHKLGVSSNADPNFTSTKDVVPELLVGGIALIAVANRGHALIRVNNYAVVPLPVWYGRLAVPTEGQCKVVSAVPDVT
jgi:hypothetical protein